MNDLRYAFRQLRKNPGFTAVAVLTLALGIGSTTAIYSVVNSALLNPVPGREPESLMQIAEQDSKTKYSQGVTPPVLKTLRANQHWFRDFAWCKAVQLARKTDDFNDVVFGFKVSPNFFTILDARPILGRTFAKDEVTPIDDDGNPADSVIVISYSFWESVFGGAADVIGKSIQLTRSRFTVIGVMPAHFKFPFDDTDGRFWLAAEDPRVRSNVDEAAFYSLLVRLKPGVDQRQTQPMLDALAQRFWQDKHGDGAEMRREGWAIRMRPLREALTDEKLQRTLVGLLAAIGFLLLVVCANIANLMLAKTENRQQELAMRAALGDFFRAMRVPLLAGRYFNKDDIAADVFYRNEIIEGTSTVIINEAMARLSWPGENALGQKFRKAETYSKRTYEVVGIVSDIRDYRYDQRVEPTFYRPYQEVNASPTFMLRTAGDPRPLIPAIRRELKAAEPDMNTPIIGVVSQALYDRTQEQRTYMLYMVVFAAVGLVLAAVGIYGVLAYSVARRTREIGIRIAVGAERRHVLGMVLAEGMRLSITGEIVGLLSAFWLTKFLRSQLFEVSPTDPAILAGVLLLLFAAAVLACWLPALRAAKVDPMVALRCE
jgi:hypothetical protein